MKDWQKVLRCVRSFLDVFTLRPDIEVRRYTWAPSNGPKGVSWHEDGLSKYGGPMLEYALVDTSVSDFGEGFLHSNDTEFRPFPWEWNPYEDDGVEVVEEAIFDNSIPEVGIKTVRLAGKDVPEVMIAWGDDSFMLFDDLEAYYLAAVKMGCCAYWFSAREGGPMRTYWEETSSTFSSVQEAVDAIVVCKPPGWKASEYETRAVELVEWLGVEHAGILFAK